MQNETHNAKSICGFLETFVNNYQVGRQVDVEIVSQSWAEMICIDQKIVHFFQSKLSWWHHFCALLPDLETMFFLMLYKFLFYLNYLYYPGNKASREVDHLTKKMYSCKWCWIICLCVCQELWPLLSQDWLKRMSW